MLRYYCGEVNLRGKDEFVKKFPVTMEYTYVPESNEYEKGTDNERELDVPSMGILSVLPNDIFQPELLG